MASSGLVQKIASEWLRRAGFRVPKPVTRLEAAKILAELFEKSGSPDLYEYEAHVWAKGNAVRVYITNLSAGKKSREPGYVEITPKGEVIHKRTLEGILVDPIRKICDSFEFDMIPEGPPGVDLREVARAVKHGNPYQKGFTDKDIQDAVRAGYLTESDVLNMDT